MGRLLVLVVLVIAAVWLIRRALRSPREPGAGPRGRAVPGELVRCAHCGVHLPRTEARAAAGALYCSDQHAQLGPGKG